MNFRERDPVIITSGRHRGTKGILSSWDGKYWCVARARGYLVFSKPENLQLISESDLEPCSKELLKSKIIDEGHSSTEKAHHSYDKQKSENGSMSKKSINIGLGQVYEYYSEQGFGFVSDKLGDNDGGIFFHINNLKKSTPKLASSIQNFGFLEKTGRKNRAYYSTIDEEYRENGTDFTKAPYFWYEFEYAEKGNRVNLVLSRDILSKRYENYLPEIISKMEDVWKSLTYPIPEYFQKECEALLGLDRVIKLKEKRIALMNQVEDHIKEVSQLDNEELKIRIKQGEFDKFFSDNDTPTIIEIVIFQHSLQKTLETIKIEKQTNID